MDPKRFKAALGQFLSGVTVVTAVRPDENGSAQLHGMTASAFVSVSIDPPLVLVSVQKTTHMHAHLAAGGPFAISLLSEDQALVSNHFAGWKKEGFEPEVIGGTFRTPVIAGALAWLDLDLYEAVSAGDHTLFIGRVVDLGLADVPAGEGALTPLAYWKGKYGVFSPAG